MKSSGEKNGWGLAATILFFVVMSFFGGNRSVNAAPAVVDPTLTPVVTFPVVSIIDFPWATLLTPIIITNVTDNDVDDVCPSLNNGYAVWYQKNNGIYRWQTSQNVSTASKVIDTSSCSGLSSYDGKVAYSHWDLEYWDGSSKGTVATGVANVISLFDDSIAYSYFDGSDFEIMIKKGMTEQQITNDALWNFSPSLYSGTVAWESDALGDPEIWYWDGHNKRQITHNSQPDEGPSLYDGTIAWFGYDGSDGEIYYWNGTTITQITNDTDGTLDEYPSLYDGKIAWQRQTANGWEIFYWDGSSITQITNNSTDDKHPSLYNGAILWQHYDGHDWEIQYAEVDVPKAPTVSTLAASAVTQTTGNINGSVNPNGQATTYHFDWGTSTSYDRVTGDKSAGAGTSSVNVYEGLTGLTAGTTYHYRLVAVNPAGTTNGTDRTFTTQSISVVLPTATTAGAEDITANSARLTGTVNPSGADTQYRFEYGGNSTSYGSHTGWVSAGNGSTDLAVAMDIGSLSEGTTYHYRLVAKNSAGTVDGDDNTFTTSTVDDPMADTARRFNGWWYNSTQSGTGIAMEIQGSTMFLAWFVYDDSGQTFWYTAGGAMANPITYTGELRQWTGWPWGQAYTMPTSAVVGTITLIFNKGSSDSVMFNASVNGKISTGSMTSFMKDFSPGDKDSRNLTGWWWDPSYDGMGFFLDARGGKMAMVWYNYRDDNSPRWWTSDGAFPDGAATYSDSLDGWQGGQCPGCTYTTPTQIPNAGGSITINFTGAANATATVGSTILHLEKFNY